MATEVLWRCLPRGRPSCPRWLTSLTARGASSFHMLSGDEVAALRARTDAFAPHPTSAVRSSCATAKDSIHLFQSMATDPLILKAAQAALGPDVKFNAMNVIGNGRGHAIARCMWTVVEFPLPLGIPRFDPRMRMPVFWMTVQIASAISTAWSTGRRNMCRAATIRAARLMRA